LSCTTWISDRDYARRADISGICGKSRWLLPQNPKTPKPQNPLFAYWLKQGEFDSGELRSSGAAENDLCYLPSDDSLLLSSHVSFHSRELVFEFSIKLLSLVILYKMVKVLSPIWWVKAVLNDVVSSFLLEKNCFSSLSECFKLNERAGRTKTCPQIINVMSGYCCTPVLQIFLVLVLINFYHWYIINLAGHIDNTLITQIKFRFIVKFDCERRLLWRYIFPIFFFLFRIDY